MRRLLMLSAITLACVAVAGAALAKDHNEWGDLPAHGHVMLIDGHLDGNQLFFDRCVEFAGGQALRTPAHHNSVHTGAAGGSPFAQGALWNAGNIVIPLAPFPFVPPTWQSCDDFTSGMTLG